MCAVLSQANQHKEALSHCELAAYLCEDNLYKTKLLFAKTVSKQKDKFENEINRPELLGRIGYSNIVTFNFIKDPNVQKAIASSKINPIIEFQINVFALLTYRKFTVTMYFIFMI